MKKAILLSLPISLLLMSIYYWQGFSSPNNEHVQVSGAYEALNFFAAQRTYPLDQLPRRAHFAAWEKAQQMPTVRHTTEPWETMGPHNFAGRTLALAFNPLNPNTLYAGSASGGLWRSYSGGLGAHAWEYVATGFPILGVSTIAFAPADSNVLYIGTGEVYNHEAAGTGAAYRNTRGSYGIGILKSADGGQNWVKSLDWTYDQNHGVWAIRVHPQNPDVVYAATTDGTYKSTNAGGNWEKIHNAVMATDLLIHPDNPDQLLVACGNFSSPGFGIYKSTNAGDNWQKISSNLPSQFNGKAQLAIAPSQPNTVYASIGNGFSVNSPENFSWLCRSDDFGSTWIIQDTTDYSKWQGWFAHHIDVNPVDPDELIAVGIAVWKWEQGDTILRIISTSGLGYDNPPIEGPDGGDKYVHSDCHYVLYHPTNPAIFYIANDGGIHRSADGGETYRSCNGGYQTVQFYNGFSNSYQDTTLCIGGLQDNGSILWNGDLTWQRIFGGDGSWSAINPSNDNMLFVSWQRLSMVRSTNRGGNFQPISPNTGVEPRAFIAPYVIAQSDSSFMYAGASSIYVTSDNGDSWSQTNNENPLDGNPILSMAISSTNKDVLYAATTPYGGQRGGVYVTTDGNSFTDITGDLPDRFPMDMTVDPTDEATAYITFSGYGTGHVFVTRDYGESWIDISNNLPDVPTNAVIVDPLYPNNIYVGNDLGVFVSVDYGESWMPYQEGLYEAVMVFDLKISPANRKLRLATHGNGAFQRDLLEQDPVSAQSPALSELNWNMTPNPSIGMLTLDYVLKNSASVQIRLVDQLGREKLKLAPLHQTPGQYTEVLDLGHLPNGTYYIQFFTDASFTTQSLILAK